MSALDRVLAARAKDVDLARRETIVISDRNVGLRVRPATFAQDRAALDQLADKSKDIEASLVLCGIHLAKYVEAVVGIGDDGETVEPFYPDGADALLDERLATELGEPWVSSAVVLRDLIGDANLEQAYGWHSQWSIPADADRPRVRRLGE